MIELRYLPLDTWRPGAVSVCVGNDPEPARDEYGFFINHPAMKWAVLQCREGDYPIDRVGWVGTEWRDVGLAT